MTVLEKEATANYVPAAAVIRRWRALSGIIGRKERCGAQPRDGMETVYLEYRRGKWNSQCSGEMRRYWEEHQWRRRLSGRCLTLRRESQGIPRLGSTAARLKLKGIDGGPHKRWSMWFNSTQREEPYQDLTLSESLRD
ncbi:hypothetical protein Lal_00002526 [Lupinus albus]|nr:hypothetical protein Lal_00002526 [Lupinus albus]